MLPTGSLLLEYWNREQGYGFNDDDDGSEADYRSPDSLYLKYGWPETQVPDFLESNHQRPVRRDASASGETKRQYSLLLIVSALLKQLRVDPTSRDATGKVERWVELAGLTLSADTIRSKLDEISDAVGKRRRKA